MYPTNQYMDPYYSYCRDHPPYPYYPPPGWEAGHRQMAMDSSCRPPSYGTLPYSGSTSHSHLPESHSCCNKTYPPGYYSFRPPFPQEFPPSHLYYHGPFPHHLNTCPSYFVPPPPYPVDQMPYDYGKFKGHCCGCPNHVCHGGEKSNLKIEEEMPEVKPDTEQKGANNSSIIGHPSYQYPAMRLPFGNMKDDVKGRCFEVPPHLFSKWVPQSGESTADGKARSNDNHNTRQLQWPVIWMPKGYDEPKQETKEFKEVDQIRKVSKEAPHSPDVKIIPLSWFEDGHNDQKPDPRDGSGEHNGRSSMMNRSAGAEHQHDTTVDRNCKTIPVLPGGVKNGNKPAEENCKAVSVVPNKEGDEKKVHTCRTIPVMDHQKKNDEKASKVEKEGENKKSNHVGTSKAKPSKLPPVCLRVDPLPKKKSRNMSSGSLNPATNKVCEKENDTKEAQRKNQETKLSGANKESNMPVKEKPSEMEKGIGSRNVIVQDACGKPAQEEDISTKVDQKVQPSVSVKAQENTSDGSLQECDKRTEEDEMKFQGEVSKSAREVNLSELDAAVRIQSAYRGYDVRRWRPLEKLRKVKKVHDQMQDLKKQLQGLEASSKQLTVKEQVAINETIMNLLLSLDSIQGLHPSAREARKSVARELVSLQEELDSFCKQLPSEPNHFRSENEEPDRTDNAIQTTAHVSTAEVSEEAKFAGAVEEQGTCSINSSEMMNGGASSGISEQLRQDAGSTEQKHEIKESSTIHDEGKAALPGECQGTSSMSALGDAALLGHSTDQKHHMEESNTMSMEELPEKEKAAAKDEGHEVSSSNCAVSLLDKSVSEESSMLQQCWGSTECDSCTDELNTGVSSPGATEDGTAATATLSMQSGALVDKDCVAEGPESSALKPAAAATEDDQYKETSAQFDQHPVHLKDAVLHEHDLRLSSVAFSQGDQPEEAMDASTQSQVDTMQDSSTGGPDGTPELTADDNSTMDCVSTVVSENPVQSSLLEETPQCDSALQESGLQESEAVKQCEVSHEDDPALVDQTNESHLERPIGGSCTEEKGEVLSSEKEAKTVESTLHVAGAPSNMCAEPVLPESVSDESPWHQDGTMSHENPDSKMSLESQGHPQNDDLSGDKTSECNEALEEASVCETGTPGGEPQSGDPKEDAAVQMASEEAAAAVSHEAVKNDEKNLADENLKLKEMLQKLLSSGNDQMGIITELSEKVRALEGKLARKRRPKVRVRRPARNATDNLH
ncbi:uncharacterized protein [Lolium perenne]|uniref:uncharacterized protein n=1 Tax=Lolium perenne TaxID=4522 RepID=UPI0021F5D605|nr:BAG family molecular chaperone regulator 6 [Lolium perenne]XP_051227295.1 BAG family molecular chaperone regulator 6 [Lolium perenne]